MTPPTWLLTKISHLQSLGFFTHEAAEHELIAEKLIKTSAESYFGPITHLHEDAYLDLIMLSHLDSYIWMIEDYLVLGSTEDYKKDFYPKVLKKLGSLSGGKFLPESIELEECGECDGRDKRIFLRFEWERESRELNFCIDGSGLVLDFLAELNEMLALTGFAYKALRDPYGLCFIMFVNEEQATELSKDHSWVWADFAGYWFERARFARENEAVESARVFFEKARNSTFDPAVYSEYGSMLEDQEEFEPAALLYLEAIEHLEKITDPSIRDEWWLKYFRRSYENLK